MYIPKENELPKENDTNEDILKFIQVFKEQPDHSDANEGIIL